jgi:hypothetical protein
MREAKPDERHRLFSLWRSSLSAGSAAAASRAAAYRGGWLLVVGLIVLACLMLPVIGREWAKQPQTTEDQLTVVNSDWGYGGYSGYRNIVGTVKNNTDHELDYVEVDFSLYDEAGNQVGDAMTNLTHMDAHGTWEFKAPVTEDHARTFKLKAVYGH